MTYSATFESGFLDLVTAAIMAPLQAVGAALWLLWRGCALLWPYRRPIALGLAVGGFVAVCVACPLLVAGLAATAAFAWVTKPRTAVRP